MQKFIAVLLSIGLGSLLLSACSGGTPGPRPDLNEVLDRTVFALERYEKYLEEKGVTQASNEHVDQLALFLGATINAEPTFYPAPIGVKAANDGSFEGYKDANGNSVQDGGEPQLFTLEIDGEKSRIIATDYTGSATSSGLSGAAAGLLGGMLLGNLMNRQRSAGIGPGAFNDRKVQSRSAYRSSYANSTRSNSARSSSRSGGPSRGK